MPKEKKPKEKKVPARAFLSSKDILPLPNSGVPSSLRAMSPLPLTIEEAQRQSETRKPKVSPTFKALKIYDEIVPTMKRSPVRTYEGREKSRGVKTDPTHVITPSIMPPVLQLPSSTKEKERFAREGSKKKDEPYERTPVQEFKKGGKVKKTGLAKVHKGELVVPAHRVASVEKAVKKAGLKPLKK